MVRPLSGLRATLLVLTLLALLPAIGLTVLTTLEARDRAVQDAFGELHLLADSQAEDQADLLQGARQTVIIVAHLRVVQQGDWAACAGDLAALLEHLPGYLNLAVADAQGQIVCSAVLPTALPSPPVGIAHRDWFQQAVATQDFAVGSYQVGRATGRASVNVAFPVLTNGTLQGVAFAALDARFLAAQVEGAPLLPGAQVLLLDRTGTVVARYPDPAGWEGRSAADQPLVQAVQRGGFSGLFEGPGLDGVDRLHAYSHLASAEGASLGRDSPLLVVVNVPREAILAPVQALFLRNVVLVGAVGAVTLGTVAVLTRRHVLDPLAELRALAGRLGEGDYGARLARPPRVREFAELGGALEGMAARVEETDRMKSRFINTAAHELRTPLTPVVVQLELLEGRFGPDAPPDLQRGWAILRRNVTRLERLIGDILDGARLQAAALSLHRTVVDLDAVLAEAVAAYQDPADAKGIRLEFEAGAAPVVFADRMRLEQVADNLLANAVKFTPPGGRIHVQTYGEAGRAVVRVADSGAGLRAEDLGRLFRPFSQVEDPMQRTNAGAGLGLYLARGIVELHGGRIWAESDGLGRGAVFAFDLPPWPGPQPGGADAAAAPRGASLAASAAAPSDDT